MLLGLWWQPGPMQRLYVLPDERWGNGGNPQRWTPRKNKYLYKYYSLFYNICYLSCGIVKKTFSELRKNAIISLKINIFTRKSVSIEIYNKLSFICYSIMFKYFCKRSRTEWLVHFSTINAGWSYKSWKGTNSKNNK